jgi:hypothetical protein
MQKINTDSQTALYDNYLKFFKIIELNSPKMMPTDNELKPRFKKFLTICTGVSDVIFELIEVYFITVLNNIMLTASFVTPSPNTILNSFGYLS